MSDLSIETLSGSPFVRNDSRVALFFACYQLFFRLLPGLVWLDLSSFNGLFRAFKPFMNSKDNVFQFVFLNDIRRHDIQVFSKRP